MAILPTVVLREIYEKALETGLERQRDILLSAIPGSFVAMMPSDGAPGPVLLRDLGYLNKDVNLVIVDEITPLAEWLLTAKALSASYPLIQLFFAERADEVIAKAAIAGGLAGENAPAAARVADLPERVIGRCDLMPVSFLARGAAAARAIVRLRVPLCIGNSLRLDAARTAKGTGWLIGPQHLLTNYHVVAARDWSDPPATAEIVAAQAAGTEAEFDYISALEGPAFTMPIRDLIASNPNLDYALLELAEPVTDREPSTLVSGALQLVTGTALAVNVVQHPRGAEKQIAIRNNLVAALRGADLAYYADTEAGSSGSPVFDDQWRVIALHKAATQRFRNLQGNPDAAGWVNIGTPINLIIDDLAQHVDGGISKIGMQFG